MINPVINILTRTSKRPNYFKNCFESVKNQTYQNINHIISVDNDETEEYVKLYTDNYIRVVPTTIEIPELDETKIRRPAKYNLYLNDLKSQVKEGYIMILDDDNKLINNNVILQLVHLLNENDNVDVLFWKFKLSNNRIIPRQDLFDRKKIIINEFDMNSFMFNINFNNLMFDYWSGGDFYFGNQLIKIINKSIWINNILTTTQRTSGKGGKGLQDDISL